MSPRDCWPTRLRRLTPASRRRKSLSTTARAVSTGKRQRYVSPPNMIRQTIAALMLLFLLSSPASAPPFDSSDPDGWLTDPSNFNDQDFVANFVASIDTVGSDKAADMLRNDALPDSRRKDILLALSAKPDTQASLIRALTRDAEKQATAK